MTMPSYSRYQHDDEKEREQGERDPIETQAEQAQSRTPQPQKVNRRHNEIDPLRKLGARMIAQARKDLIDSIYKDKDPDPEPKEYIFGDGILKACEWAEVSVRAVRRSMREIIEEAEGPLKDRKFASLSEVKADGDEWITTEEVARRFAVVSHETVARWASEGQINGLKAREDGVGTFRWMIRVDDTLLGKLDWYKERHGS